MNSLIPTCTVQQSSYLLFGLLLCRFPSALAMSLPHHTLTWLRLLFYLFIASNAPVVLAQCAAQCITMHRRNVPTNQAANKLLSQTKQASNQATNQVAADSQTPTHQSTCISSQLANHPSVHLPLLPIIPHHYYFCNKSCP